MATALIESYLLDSTAEVLESMCFATIEQQFSGTQYLSFSSAQRELSVGRYLYFRGPFSGWFGVRTSLDAARLIAANLLGEDEEDVREEQANEAIGEIANMICGAMLAKIEGKQPFKLSSPERWPAESILSAGNPFADTAEHSEMATPVWTPGTVTEEIASNYAVPEILQCLFELDCGQLLVWMRVS